VLAEPVLGAPDLPATLETLGKVAYSLPAPAGLQLQALVLEARRAKCAPPPCAGPPAPLGMRGCVPCLRCGRVGKRVTGLQA